MAIRNNIITAVLGCTLFATLLTAQDRYRIETVAGQPAPLGVPATATYLMGPQGLLIDGSDNLFVETYGTVKKVASGTTIVTRFTGIIGPILTATAEGGPAVDAS
jgi:hypothetical protein